MICILKCCAVGYEESTWARFRMCRLLRQPIAGEEEVAVALHGRCASRLVCRLDDDGGDGVSPPLNARPCLLDCRFFRYHIQQLHHAQEPPQLSTSTPDLFIGFLPLLLSLLALASRLCICQEKSGHCIVCFPMMLNYNFRTSSHLSTSSHPL
jgi:hypothetical protein